MFNSHIFYTKAFVDLSQAFFWNIVAKSLLDNCSTLLCWQEGIILQVVFPFNIILYFYWYWKWSSSWWISFLCTITFLMKSLHYLYSRGHRDFCQSFDLHPTSLNLSEVCPRSIPQAYYQESLFLWVRSIDTPRWYALLLYAFSFNFLFSKEVLQCYSRRKPDSGHRYRQAFHHLNWSRELQLLILFLLLKLWNQMQMEIAYQLPRQHSSFVTEINSINV